MTTSGETTFNPVRDVVVKSALRLVGAYATGGLPKAQQILDANTALNMMIKTWQTQNFMWVKEFVTLFLAGEQRIYDLPGANGASSYIETTVISEVQVASPDVIPVTSSAGMSVGDIFGVLLDDNSIDWGVILTVDTATQVTLTADIDGAASATNAVYSYAVADALYRPTRIFHSNRLLEQDSEVPLTHLGRDDYQDLTNKRSAGTPVQIYYDPQLATGKLYVWPVPIDAREKLVLSVDRPLQVMIDSANTYDFPEEWIEVLKYGLAVRLAPEYAVPLAERRELKSEFAQFASNLTDYDIDDVSTTLGINYYG
jgi:hypothetical protein